MPNLFRATPQPSSDKQPLRSKANQHGGRAFWRPPTGTRDATNNPQRLHDQLHSGHSVRVHTPTNNRRVRGVMLLVAMVLASGCGGETATPRQPSTTATSTTGTSTTGTSTTGTSTTADIAAVIATLRPLYLPVMDPLETAVSDLLCKAARDGADGATLSQTIRAIGEPASHVAAVAATALNQLSASKPLQRLDSVYLLQHDLADLIRDLRGDGNIAADLNGMLIDDNTARSTLQLTPVSTDDNGVPLAAQRCS